MHRIDNVLDDNIGFIELVNHMGNDETVVNSARVSFGKRIEKLSTSDIKLIKYLAKHKHWSPFRHVQFQFHIKAPEIVGRQFYKHCIGSDYTFKDHAWNEISGRYVIYNEEFYCPSTYRKQSADNKQASVNASVDRVYDLDQLYRDTIKNSYDTYRKLIDMGLCKEQARGVLPVSFYTEWYWSASLQAVINLITLRDHDHAQWEIRMYAIAMLDLIKHIVPNSVNALLENM